MSLMESCRGLQHEAKCITFAQAAEPGEAAEPVGAAGGLGQGRSGSGHALWQRRAGCAICGRQKRLRLAQLLTQSLAQPVRRVHPAAATANNWKSSRTHR